jgi:hypothetical protein
MFFTAKIQARTAAIGAGVGHKPKIPAIDPAACVLLAKMRSLKPTGQLILLGVKMY